MEIIVRTYKPDYLFTVITTALHPKKLNNIFEALSRGVFIFPVIATGPIMIECKVAIPENFHIIKSVSDLESFV